MTTVDPTREQIKRLAEDAATRTGPVIMVNLLRFADDEGRASYDAYAARALPHIERVGGRIVASGTAAAAVIGSDPWWDEIVLVEYPSRQAFLDMAMHPDYQAFTHLRTAALADARLIPVDPAPLGVPHA